MRPFCERCAHSLVDDKVKKLFNKYVKNILIHCPEDNEKVVGCFMSRMEVDWENFTKWCYENKYLVETRELASGPT